MTGIEIVVVVTALAAMAWVNWYFFLSRKPVAGAIAGAGGMQEVLVVVRGGYEPGAIRVKAGSPVRLVFDRQETSGCSEEVVFPDFAVKRYLPAHEQTAIDLGPVTEGEYEFTCGMGMLRGRLIVEA